MTGSMLLPTSPLHAELHGELVSFIRTKARAWRADATQSKRQFQMCMASELQVMAAMLARELGSPETYMQAAWIAWDMAEQRNYTGDDLCNDTAGLVS